MPDLRRNGFQVGVANQLEKLSGPEGGLAPALVSSKLGTWNLKLETFDSFLFTIHDLPFTIFPWTITKANS
jgi:hypothetical protein